jgi:heterotetrameric sarcosine oxidase gamma subunit
MHDTLGFVSSRRDLSVHATTHPARVRITVQPDAFSRALRVQFHKSGGPGLGLASPGQPHILSNGQVVVVWLARNDWLLLDRGSNPGAADELAQSMGQGLRAVNDLTHGLTWLVLEGDGIYDLLSCVCCLGWQAGIGVDRATATWLAGCQALVYDEVSKGRFTIMIDRSLAPGLRDLLLELTRTEHHAQHP